MALLSRSLYYVSSLFFHIWYFGVTFTVGIFSWKFSFIILIIYPTLSKRLWQMNMKQWWVQVDHTIRYYVSQSEKFTINYHILRSVKIPVDIAITLFLTEIINVKISSTDPIYCLSQFYFHVRFKILVWRIIVVPFYAKNYQKQMTWD